MLCCFSGYLKGRKDCERKECEIKKCGIKECEYWADLDSLIPHFPKE